jgi:hypothetical protein
MNEFKIPEMRIAVPKLAVANAVWELHSYHTFSRCMQPRGFHREAQNTSIVAVPTPARS